MRDPRAERLAELITGYSLRVRDFLFLVSNAKGEHVRERNLRRFFQRTDQIRESAPLPPPERVADLLLAVRRDVVLLPVLNGNAKGFSTGPRDLWQAITLQD